jgi:hypothetical protein
MCESENIDVGFCFDDFFGLEFDFSSRTNEMTQNSCLPGKDILPRTMSFSSFFKCFI